MVFALTCFNTRGQAVKRDLKLWYKQPSQKWTDALPIGNGRMGAMIYGGVSEERVQFNEGTLWTDGPRPHHRDGAVNYLQPIRQLLFEGKQKEAEDMAAKHFMGRKSNEDDYDSLKNAWFNKVRSNTAPSATSFNDAAWKEMKLPTPEGWEETYLEGEDGAAWFRTSFNLPQDWVGKNLVIELGRIRDLDFTYVNGKQIGTKEGISGNRRYVIPSSVLKAGKNQIAIHVINWYDKGGLTGVKNAAKSFFVYPEGGSNKNGLELNTTWKYWVQDTNPPAFPQFEASYQPFGDVYMRFKNANNVTNYRRELDITNAVSRVSYTKDGVTYTREYLATAPGNAVVMHLTASKGGMLNLDALLESPHKLSSTKRIDNNTIGLSLKVRNGVLNGVSYLHVTAVGGKVISANDKISITGADEVTLYLTAATSFKSYKDVSGNPGVIAKQALQNIKGKKYEVIKETHTKDYESYFNTLSLNLGSSNNQDLPTDERILKYNNVSDPSLVTLYFQYARYLLISSSRPGGQAANLQGIWNNLLTPPWGSKYTTNINLQMNYWPAEMLNLSACAEPLFNLIDEAAEAGKLTAKAHYGAPGWVLHHNTDLWRGTAPINASNHGVWVTGAGWLSYHLWEHYLFTQDKEFLQKRAYPIMKDAASFFVNFLIKDPVTGYLISTPSNSPEHRGLVAGPTMDHQIIRDLFKSCIKAADILNTDKEFAQTLAEKIAQIAPNKIGKLGNLQEWMQDVEDTTEKHRHVSHLWGVHPGTDITWDSANMMKAARQSLLYRGDEGTGWSLAWKVNLWARFKDGDHAMMMMNKLLSPAEGASGGERGGVYRNLFDAHPPFQIDGNFGGAAGLGEMLVQSHTKYIELLPALPSALPNGEIKGICVRGGFVLNLTWQKGQLQQVEVLSKTGNDCLLKYGDKTTEIKTEKGKTYRLNVELKSI
ncbi:MAG: Alpha-L-fucosidase [Segetibacter sp.]|nr:Alpha-L-fucosidase [Segetibacter sp.]